MNQYYHLTDYEQGRHMMIEPFDVYVDQVMLAISPYGVALNFRKSSPKPAAPGTVPQADDVGTIRMSLEHAKIMTFLIKRQLDEAQSSLGVDVQIPIRLMNDLRIAPEDWQKFWQRS